jgi:hypothetical protein
MNTERIDDVPEIKGYPHLSLAHKGGNLVVFVGAGVSAIWGCKRWQEMAVRLIDDCYDIGEIDYWKRKVLIDKYRNNPRKLITFAKSMLGPLYIDRLKKCIECSPVKKDKYPRLFENLVALNAIFVTTNIDDYLSSLLDKGNVHVDVDSFAIDKFRPKNCFHLHGLVSKTDSLVMTIEEYVKRYQNERQKKLLERIFFEEDYVVLFMGYSVDEMELIDYLVEKYSGAAKKQINKNYILMPVFRREAELLKHENHYFDLLQTSVIPYAIDGKGYEQIYDLIENWKIQLVTPNDQDEFYKFTKLIEGNK